MQLSRRKLYSQNFLRSLSLANELVAQSSIVKDDLALEIGPGNGRLTKPLLARAGKVIAVEADKYYVTLLRKKFADQGHLKVVHKGILECRLPERPYKVFSNIPFSIEGKILRYLLDAPVPALEIFLVVRKQFGYKLAIGKPGFLPLSYMPWYDFSITHRFSQKDFWPVPRVSSVLLKIVRKDTPLLSLSSRKDFRQFLRVGFGNGLPAYRNIFSHHNDKNKVQKVFSKLGVSRREKPKNISMKKWVGLYGGLKCGDAN